MTSSPAGETPDFLVIGHVVQDLLPEKDGAGWRLGGAAAYCSLLARNLGLRAAVLTSAAAELDLPMVLPRIDCVCIPSERTTQIRNVYRGRRRTQYITQAAARLLPEHLPSAWRRAKIVLLGPVAGEVDEDLAACFPGSLLGAGAQGWLREVGPDARVRPVPPERWGPGPALRHARALFVSDEDIPPESAPEAIGRWAKATELVAFTRGYGGADVVHFGAQRHIGAFPADAVDPTGAGDVFAAAFLIRWSETGDVWDATRFASCAASFAVEGEGVSGVPQRAAIEERLAQYPEIIAG